MVPDIPEDTLDDVTTDIEEDTPVVPDIPGDVASEALIKRLKFRIFLLITTSQCNKTMLLQQ